MSEKQLALLASTVALVLATLSATALISINSVRSELASVRSDLATHKAESQRLTAVVAQLKDNQLAMLPLITPGGYPDSRSAGADAPLPGSQPSADAQLEQVTELPRAGASIGHQAGKAETPEPSKAPSLPPRPAAPTPLGVKVFPAPDSRLVPPPPAIETGAPQAAIPREEDTILAALQNPSMGVKTHPVLEQVKAPPIVSAPRQPKRLENVDGILVERIVANWKRPHGARNGMVVEIDIKIARDGRIRSANVVNSSGNKAFDDSATKAIKAVKRIAEMSQVSDATYRELYKDRRVKFSPEDLSG